MRICLLIALALVLTIIAVNGQDIFCPNASQQGYRSSYALGYSNEMNKTFNLFNPTKMPNVYNKNGFFSASYNISSFVGTWKFFDSQQQQKLANIDSILTFGGYATFNYNFNWLKKQLGQKSGTASGSIGPFYVNMTKNITYPSGYIIYTLANITLINTTNYNFTITSMNPFDQDIQTTLLELLNQANEVGADVDALATLQSIFNGNISAYAQQILDDESDDEAALYYNYTYNSPYQSSQSILLYSPLNGQYLTTDGFYEARDTQFANATSAICMSFDLEPLNQTYFGGIQQFYSNGLFNQAFFWGLSNNFFNTILNGKMWPISNFQFFAGDIYYVIPSVLNDNFPDDPVNGACTWNNSNTSALFFADQDEDVYNATAVYNCNLFISRTGQQIAQWQITLSWYVYPVANRDTIDFVLADFELQNTTYTDLPGYKVENPEVADYYITQGLQTMVGQNVFGSGFPTWHRDAPYADIYENFTIIYDQAN